MAGLGITNLGSTVPVGTSTLAFTGIVHEGDAVTGAPLVTCAKSITVVAN